MHSIYIFFYIFFISHIVCYFAWHLVVVVFVILCGFCYFIFFFPLAPFFVLVFIVVWCVCACAIRTQRKAHTVWESSTFICIAQSIPITHLHNQYNKYTNALFVCIVSLILVVFYRLTTMDLLLYIVWRRRDVCNVLHESHIHRFEVICVVILLRHSIFFLLRFVFCLWSMENC